MIKISEELSVQLREAFKTAILQKNYDKIFKQCFLNLADEELNTKTLINLREGSGDSETFNFVYNSIFLLTVEALNANLLPEETVSLLEEYIADKDIIQNYISKMNDFKSFLESEDNEIKDAKFDSSIDMNRIIDIEWEVLHTIATKHLLRVSKDVYLIKLKYQTSKGEVKMTDFRCNYEELVSLVENLNIACNSIGKVCDSIETSKNN